MRVLLIVLILLAAVLVAFVGGSYWYFERPASCGICHIMKEYPTSWEKTPHAKANVDCYDCHSVPGIRGRLKAHFIDGARDVFWNFIGKPSLRAEVSNNQCFACHFAYGKESKNRVATAHFEFYLTNGRSCTDCHLQLAHVTAEKERLPKAVMDDWATADVCRKCHDKPQGEEWADALHSEAIFVLQPKNVANDRCIGCHTLGYKKGGFESIEKTPKLAGVQCENCHGKGAKHIANPKPNNVPVAALKAEMCGECHSGAHHNTFSDVEWKGTKHAQALTALLEFKKKVPEAVKDECLQCHSVDYRLAPADKKPTLKTAKLPITCQTCHDTHSTETRISVKFLCTSCHTGGAELGIGQEVHHATKEMYFGRLIEGSGINVPPTFLKHTANGVSCPQCHMFKRAYVSETDPAKTGHDFKAKPEGCNVCHPDRGVEANAAIIANTQAPIKAQLAELKPRVDAAKAKFTQLDKAKKVTKEMKKVYDLAIFGYDFVDQDGSNGFHNPQYAQGMLDLAKPNLAAWEAQTAGM